MPELIVVNGAYLACSLGSVPATLVVTSNTVEKIGGQLVGTVDDAVSMTNVPSFGTCSLLTTQAGGVTCTCIPWLITPWSSGATTHKINGLAVLTASSTLPCMVGGTISINYPAQIIATAD